MLACKEIQIRLVVRRFCIIILFVHGRFVYYTIHIFIMHVTVMWVHTTVRTDYRRDTKSRRVLDLV